MGRASGRNKQHLPVTDKFHTNRVLIRLFTCCVKRENIIFDIYNIFSTTDFNWRAQILLRGKMYYNVDKTKAIMI